MNRHLTSILSIGDTALRSHTSLIPPGLGQFKWSRHPSSRLGPRQPSGRALRLAPPRAICPLRGCLESRLQLRRPGAGADSPAALKQPGTLRIRRQAKAAREEEERKRKEEEAARLRQQQEQAGQEQAQQVFARAHGCRLPRVFNRRGTLGLSFSRSPLKSSPCRMLRNVCCTLFSRLISSPERALLHSANPRGSHHYYPFGYHVVCIKF